MNIIEALELNNTSEVMVQYKSGLPPSIYGIGTMKCTSFGANMITSNWLKVKTRVSKDELREYLNANSQWSGGAIELLNRIAEYGLI